MSTRIVASSFSVVLSNLRSMGKGNARLFDEWIPAQIPELQGEVRDSELAAVVNPDDFPRSEVDDAGPGVPCQRRTVVREGWSPHAHDLAGLDPLDEIEVVEDRFHCEDIIVLSVRCWVPDNIDVLSLAISRRLGQRQRLG